MSLRKTVLLLAAIVTAFATLPVQAQFAVYGTFTANELSNIVSSPEPNPNNLGTPRNSVNLIGGTGGVYYDFMNLGPVRLGADLRGTINTTKQGAYQSYNGGGAKLDSGLGGIRAVFHTPIAPIHPYIQGSVGIARTNYGLLYNEEGVTNNGIVGNSLILHNNFQYEGFAGVDITVMPFLDIRLVELGYGGINPFGTYSHNYPVKTVGSGLVFHLPF